MNSDPLKSGDQLCPRWVCVIALLLLLVVVVPLFVCSPVTSDTSLFDVQAMAAMRGGVLYRDIIEPNLPGVVWIHMAVRSVIGWSSEAIRIVDLLIFGLIIFLLSRVLKSCRLDARRNSAGIFVFTSAFFYLTRNEWCHCQRDIWMLLPSSCALWLRCQRNQTDWPYPAAAIVEGVFWGIAFWIKPHVAIPVMAILLVELRHSKSWKLAGKDILLVVAGGVVSAVPGIVWLIVTGAWDHFWEMMLDWNPEYLATGRTRRSVLRITQMLERFYPWWLLHLLAVPLAGIAIFQSLKARNGGNISSAERMKVAMAACYIAWLSQTFFLQHAMDYIHVPELLLAIFVIAAHPWRLDAGLRRVAVGFVLALALITAPQLQERRLMVWSRCFTEGSTPTMRSILAQGNYPDWIHLEEVRKFLADQQIQDGDLACLNVHSVHLHQELKVLPATRYWSISCLLTMFPTRYDHIMTAVEASNQQFVVIEGNEMNHPNQIHPKRYPHEFPVVFESGSYKVFAVNASSKQSVAASDASSL